MPSLDHLTPAEHVLLARVKRALRERYGDRLRQVILFGSRARGDARQDSDWDIAVVLEGYDGGLGEILALSKLGHDLMTETGDIVSIKPFTAEDVSARTIFMRHLQMDGVAL